MAQFWERRALSEEGAGNRDTALLSRLQAVVAKSTDLRHVDDWMMRLALKFDERWKIVLSQPVGAMPTREERRYFSTAKKKALKPPRRQERQEKGK